MNDFFNSSELLELSATKVENMKYFGYKGRLMKFHKKFSATRELFGTEVLLQCYQYKHMGSGLYVSIFIGEDEVLLVEAGTDISEEGEINE